MFHRNTHSSVVEYRISNPMTRVRFPLSVKKSSLLLFKRQHKASYSKQYNNDYYPLKPVRTRMSEWLRRQIQDLLRKLMGSNPIPRKEFPCSLKTWWWQVRPNSKNRFSSVGRSVGLLSPMSRVRAPQSV